MVWVYVLGLGFVLFDGWVFIVLWILGFLGLVALVGWRNAVLGGLVLLVVLVVCLVWVGFVCVWVGFGWLCLFCR